MKLKVFHLHFAFSKPSVHARGKGKQAHELSDIDKKKAKHLEHQVIHLILNLIKKNWKISQIMVVFC